MRLFFVKPGINALGQPLGIMFTVDNLFDMFLLMLCSAILILGLAVSVLFFLALGNSAPPGGYPTSAQYQAL